MFELESNTRLHVVNVNPRREKHGEDNVPAVDLKLRMEASNTVLAMFHGALRSALYHRSAAASDNPQASLEGVAPVSDLPNLRFPKLEPIRWDDELSGYTLRIDHGLGGKSDLVLEGCTINSFGIECKEGGTVVVTFRLQCNAIAEREIGKLCLMIDQEIEATLIPPAEGVHKGKGDDKALNTAGDNEAWPFPTPGGQPPATEKPAKRGRGKGARTPEEALAGST
jgi:hypothetical protein